MTGWIPTTSLPAGDYGWRVQRLDVDNRPGPWSAPTNAELRHFTVAGNQVSLLTPNDGANFGNHNQSFTWSTAPGAATYRFQTSTAADFTSLKESVATVMTSWHPQIAYTDGTYYWRVLTLDGAGNTTATSQVRTFTHGPPPPAPVYYHPLTPTRILNSKPGVGNRGPYTTKWGPNVTRTVPVAGLGGVPADAEAVAVNVAVTGTTAASFLNIWPNGQSQTLASTINWKAGDTIANAATFKVGTANSVKIRNAAGFTDVVFDVVGYYDDDSGTGAGLTPQDPKRILDTRPGAGNVGPYTTKFSAGVPRDVTVAGGITGVPANADAVVLNVAATGGSATSYLKVWPKGEVAPNASSLNFKAGQTLANSVTAKVGAGGQVQVLNSAGTVNVIVDVVGYFDQGSGSPFRPLPNPVRIQDSRSTHKVGAYSTPWGAGTDRTVQVTGNLANVPPSAVAALLNVAVTAPTLSSYLRVYPNGSPLPTASSLNWTAGMTVANSVTAKIGDTGKIRAKNQTGSVHVIMDISGYYGP